MDEKLREIIHQIEAYSGFTPQCPEGLGHAIASYFSFPRKRNGKIYEAKLNWLAFVLIGGDGITIKCQEKYWKPDPKHPNDKGFVCLKIAKERSQIKPQTPSRIDLRSLTSIMRKETPLNDSHDRFIAGAEAQQDLNSLLPDESERNFYIPEVYQYSDLPATHILMEWCESPQILNYLKERNSLRFSVEMFLKFLDSVRWLHSKGYIHRDLKAANVLAGPKDSVILVDFNGVKSPKDRGITKQGIVGGTEGYLSPKMADGYYRDASFADDIYGAGMVFYEFLTCQKLPLLELKENTEQKRLNFRRRLIEKIPDSAAQWFWKATEYREEKRYATIRQFQADVEFYLSQILAEEQITQDANVLPEVFVDSDLEDLEASWHELLQGKPFAEAAESLCEFGEKLVDWKLKKILGKQ